MKRLLFIARSEYIRQITRRGFLVAMFGTPLLMLAMITIMVVIMVLMVSFDEHEEAIGYVDLAGVIREEVNLPEPAMDFVSLVPLEPYASKPEAHDHFVGGAVDAYVIIPPDYLETGTITAYVHKPLSLDGKFTLRWMLRKSLLFHEPSDKANLAALPLDDLDFEKITLEPEPDEGEEGAVGVRATRDMTWLFPLALVFGMMFVGTVFSSSSYLLQALIDEKENRTMEIVVTSVTPNQLIGGKIIGLGALGLTQSGVWLSYGLGPIAIGSSFFQPLRSLLFGLTGELLPVAILSFIPAYLFYAGLIVTIGAIVTSVQQGQQLASFLLLPMLLPLLLIEVLESNPNGVIALLCSLIPMTAPLTLMIRQSLTVVPLWQIGISLMVLYGCAVLMIKLSASIFRFGMLRYGKRLGLRDMVRLLRSRARRGKG